MFCAIFNFQTRSRALQKKFGYNTMMISQDEIRRNILWVKDDVDTRACLKNI